MTHPLEVFLGLAAEGPDKLMVAQDDRLLTRADILSLAGSFAGTIGARLGSRRENGLAPVLISLPNSPEMIAVVVAVWSLGGLPMFFSSKATAAQRDAVVQRHDPALIIDELTLPTLAGLDQGIGMARPDEDSDASVVFTSGSTGIPKGVVQKGGTLVSGVRRVAQSLGYDDPERILVPIPFAHDYGWGQMLSGLVGGHQLILPRRDILADISLAINDHRPTVFAGVPSLYSALLFGISGFERADTDCIRLLTSTGSPFSPLLYQALQKRIPDASIVRNYGLTETYRGCCLRPEDGERTPDTVGRPIPGVSLVIADSDGNPLPFGSEGEVVHVGAGVFDRYLDNPQATAATRRLVNGKPAVFTGDFGVLDKDGFLRLLGRRDRLIKSMDIRVNLNDVEEALAALDTVSSVAVIARQNQRQETEIVAFCIPKNGATGKEIRNEANRKLPPYMRPSQIECLTEMPRTPVGKVDYPALKGMILIS